MDDISPSTPASRNRYGAQGISRATPAVRTGRQPHPPDSDTRRSSSSGWTGGPEGFRSHHTDLYLLASTSPSRQARRRDSRVHPPQENSRHNVGVPSRLGVSSSRGLPERSSTRRCDPLARLVRHRRGSQLGLARALDLRSRPIIDSRFLRRCSSGSVPTRRRNTRLYAFRPLGDLP